MDNGTGDDYTLNVKPLQVFLSNKKKLEIAEKVLNSWDDQPTNQPEGSGKGREGAAKPNSSLDQKHDVFAQLHREEKDQVDHALQMPYFLLQGWR